MNNKNIQLITRTAMLLAITLLFQQLRLLIGATMVSTIIIGSLVNLALFVSAATVGWRGSIFVAVLSPVVAALQGHLPHPLLIPFVAAGNLTLVLVYELAAGKQGNAVKQWFAVAAASLAKTAVLYVAVVLVFVPLILPGLNAPEKLLKAMQAALPVSFSWPQLVTAAIGGIVSIPVISGIRRAFQKENGAGAR